jgi:predicted esterase
VFDHVHNLFVHGHSAAIENEANLVSVDAKGNRIRVTGRPSTDNWLHYAVPSPVIVDERRLRPGRAWLRYKTSGNASVNAVHVWDGDTRIAAVSSPSGVVEGGWTRVTVGFDSQEVLAVFWGLGVSIGVSFGPGGGDVEIATVGCDFDYANRVCSQRFPIRTDKRKTLEFPYRSNRPIDVPSDAIRRILISLHGTGGDGDLYLDNGLAAADTAGGGVLGETLIIAPQFIYPREYYRTSEYYRTHLRVNDFPADLLHWQSGRAYAAESVERDLNGDGAPDSGTVSSFAVLDTLLERVSKPALFPNLQRIVIAGQSNGGQFVARYAATSPFEDEVANRRGIQVRYVAMSSGSYLYLDEKRAVAGTTNSFAAPTGCPGYDDWPWGLENLPDYPARLGARRIRDQFRDRDVIYMQGALDTDPHTDDCEVELQGGNTVEKGEIYFNYLQDHYGAAVHQRLVVAGVGHSGRGLMTSADGLAVLFGP